MFTKHGGARWLCVSLLALSLGCNGNGGDGGGKKEEPENVGGGTTYVEVWLKENLTGISGCRATDAGGNVLEKVYAPPGSVIRWHCELSESTVMKAPPGVFPETEYTHVPGGTLDTKLLATTGEHTLPTSCWDGGDTGPTVVVGEPPGGG